MMRAWIIGLLLAGPAWADSVVYYDSSTGSVVGTYSSTDSVDANKSGAQFGVGQGSITSLRLPALPPKSRTQKYQVSNGSVSTLTDQSVVDQDSLRSSTRNKLIQGKPLTDEEANELVP